MGKNYVNEKAKKEWEDRNKEAKKDEAPILQGAAKVEEERVRKGGVNFALYNMVLSVANFKDCETALDSCRRTYECLYPYITNLVRDNEALRKAVKTNKEMMESPIIKEIISREGDVQVIATSIINQITNAARERSMKRKLNIKEVKKPIEIIR